MLSGARYRSGAAQIAAGGALSPTARAVLPALAKCFAAADLDATPQAAFLASARCDGLADLLARFGLAPWGATLFLDVTTRPACADSSVRADCRPTHPTVAVSLASDRAIFEDATRTITPHVAAEP
ncbi:MAG: hypothetical protein FJX74_01420 [Armatimonadetes bacterium]|nr:hypothetical protein [Armatimonadota bacterium]